MAALHDPLDPVQVAKHLDPVKARALKQRPDAVCLAQADLEDVYTRDTGSLTIGGTSALNMDDGMRQVYSADYGMFVEIPSNYGSGYVDVIKQQAEDLGVTTPPPIFVSSEGGVAYTDLSNFTVVTGAEVYQGDYLALYWYNLGIALGFNEGPNADGKLAAEPTPPATPLITEAHGY